MVEKILNDIYNNINSILKNNTFNNDVKINNNLNDYGKIMSNIDILNNHFSGELLNKNIDNSNEKINDLVYLCFKKFEYNYHNIEKNYNDVNKTFTNVLNLEK